MWSRAVFLGMLLITGHASAETLLVETQDGSYSAGVALEHRVDGESLILTLREGADAEAIAKLLRERLAQVEIQIDGANLILSGIPPTTLLGQLTRVDVTGDGGSQDPLEELNALGGGLAMSDGQEQGGSIRAGNPVASAPGVVTHDKAERLVGQITKVVRGDFPQVVVSFRVRWPIQAGPLKGKWKKGALVSAPVITSLDLSGEAMQRNLGGYYLAAGDRIWVHLILDSKGAPQIDWIERRKPPRK